AERLVGEVGKTRMLSLRRFMLRVAERVAEGTDVAGIVTGEAIGQKSSQTSANLAVTDRATRLPVHRPLLTRDKQDIVAHARKIGTYEDATIEAGCNRIAPDYPETNASIAAVEAAEPDLGPLVEESLSGIETVDL
ncbi:MAG: tRNA 4-thiouridine(8) synthase ThiI, partial [Halalkalicoccus sp.]